tara:strand:- start:3444 stop:4127 length:684 start_codon:yes stop_codon:yes gene_type:complete
MIINTDAIVLKTFSYGETSLISRCFTKNKGKISFIIKGAKSKKNLISPYFQPLSYINIIYKENEKRELQIVSKVSFVQIWTSIPLSLKKVSLSQSILEITDFTLEKNDPYIELFNILIKTFQNFESGNLNESIVFWNYECKILSEMGFMIDIEDDFDSELKTLKTNNESFNTIQQLINGSILDIELDTISSENKKKISKFLYQKLCFYFEGFERLNSFRVIKDIFYS